jgi:hypothetical protein
MAWTNPKTWTVGEILTSADMNTYVRDNTLQLARGRIATATYTQDSGTSYPGGNLASVTHTFVSSRLYRVKLTIPNWVKQSTSDVVQVIVRRNTTDLSALATYYLPSGQNGTPVYVEFPITDSGSQTYHLRVVPATGFIRVRGDLAAARIELSDDGAL